MAEDILISLNDEKTARHYYELHITLDAKDNFDNFLNFCNKIEWRGSRFSEDEVDHYHGKWFASARCHRESSIKIWLKEAINAFQEAGYNVIRWKAEDTLLDSKYGDTLS